MFSRQFYSRAFVAVLGLSLWISNAQAAFDAPFPDAKCRDVPASGQSGATRFAADVSGQYICFDMPVASAGIGVATVKRRSSSGDFDVKVYRHGRSTTETTGTNSGGTAELVPFGAVTENGRYQIIIYDASGQGGVVDYYLHRTDFERAVEGALQGVFHTVAETGVISALEIICGCELNDQPIINPDNVSRGLSLAFSQLQGSNLAGTTADAVTNELGLALQQAGINRAVANIVTGAFGEVIGDVFRHYDLVN